MFKVNYKFLFVLSIFLTICTQSSSKHQLKTDYLKQKCMIRNSQNVCNEILNAKSLFEKYNNFLIEKLGHRKLDYSIYNYLFVEDTSAQSLYRKLFENYLTKLQDSLNVDEKRNINSLINAIYNFEFDYFVLLNTRMELMLFIYTDGFECLMDKKDDIFECINQDLNLSIPKELTWIDFLVETAKNINICRSPPLVKCFEKSSRNCTPSPAIPVLSTIIRC